MVVLNQRETVSNVPRARVLLTQMARDLRKEGDLDRSNYILECIIPLLHRRKPAKVAARAKAPPVTPHIRDSVKLYIKRNEGVSNRVVGRHFGIDGGRVSEILQGDYDD